jgi:iron complex transport system substrate-binding protein
LDDVLRAALVCCLLVLAGIPPVAAASAGVPADRTPAGSSDHPSVYPSHGATNSPSTTGAAVADCGFPLTVTDATGANVTVSDRPERIVTLNPSAAQTLWALGARDRVVGVSEFADYLNGTTDLPVVNTAAGGVNTERIVALDPDLVLAPGTIPSGTVDSLREVGLTVVALNTSTSIAGVESKTRRIGRLTGECDAAARTNGWMRRHVAAVREAVADEPRPTALYVFGDGYTVGADTFIHDVMRTAGVRNVAAAAGIEGYARISREVVRERNPEWLVRNSRDEVPDDPVYRETSAVRNDRIVVVNVDYLNQPAPRSIVRAVRTIARAVHPGATADLGPVSRQTEAATGPTRTATASPDRTRTATDGPGFGPLVPAVALALLVAGLLARRRA